MKRVSPGTVPNTGHSAHSVLVDEAGEWREFFVPDDQPAPPEGEVIEWGPRHAWWGNERVDKSYTYDPNRKQI